VTTPKKKAKSKYRCARLLRTHDIAAFVAMDQHAKAGGLSFNAWALSVLLAKIKYVKREEAKGNR
jgi:hypothetical protein